MNTTSNTDSARAQRAADHAKPNEWIAYKGNPITIGTHATIHTATSRRTVRVIATKPGFLMFG